MAAKTIPAHNIFVGIAFELIGVSVLAIFADMSDDLGELMVVVMVGWFIVFLSINAEWLQHVVPGAKSGTASIQQYTNKLVPSSAQ